MRQDLLFIDTETGGLNAEQDALLSLGLVHWKDGHIVSTEELLVQPEGRNVGDEALRINRIDMSKHRQVALPRRKAAERMYKFIEKEFPWANHRERVILGGHNVSFDVGFVRPLFGEYWKQLILHRTVDTSAILQFLYDAGVLSSEIQGLDQATRRFNIEIPEGRRHTALADASATALLYGALVETVAALGRQPGLI